MIAAFLFDPGLVSGQWVAVFCIALAFFLVQMALTVHFYFRMRRQESALRRLCRDFEQGGDGRKNVHSTLDHFEWLRWVISSFPANTTHPPGNFTREDVLQELDTRISSYSDYLLLQRMGVMAPLLGVVLTVVGFYWLNVGDDDQSLQSILTAVVPLVSGVGAGAVLALINQVLLHIVGNRAESLRLTARTWFDTVIWSHIGLDTQAATVKSVRAMERFAGSIGDAAERYVLNATQINESTAAMNHAASQFRKVVQTFSSEIEGIPEALSEVRRATAASAESLEELIQVGSRAVANLDVSVAAFRTTLDREFTEAAKLHHHSSHLFAESVQQIGDATDRLKSGSDDLKNLSQANTAAFERMDESIRHHVVPGNARFYEAVQALAAQIAAFSTDVGTLTKKVEAVAGGFDKVSSQLAPSVSSFCDAIDHRFGPAVAQQSNQIDTVNRSMQQLQEVAASVARGATALSATLQEASQFVSHTKKSHELLSTAANNLSEVGRQLKESIEGDVAPSQRAMHETASSVAQSAARLSEFTNKGLAPATRQLATLHQTLAGLEGSVAALRTLSSARPDIDRLTNTLARAAEISDAISALPAQIRRVVDQEMDHNDVASNSRGGIMSWLTRRPK